jgi:hypothetical protein
LPTPAGAAGDRFAGRPFGDADWMQKTARKLLLESSVIAAASSDKQ